MNLMRSGYLLNKQLFIGYLFLTISLFTSLIYCFEIDFYNGDYTDSVNYFLGYKYLLKNFSDFTGFKKLMFFGTGSEFIYTYFVNLITIFGKININTFIFISSSFIYGLLSYAYLNIHKIYNTSFSKTSTGLQLQLLSAVIPLGLSVQVGRQAFGFSLFLSLIVVLRKFKIFSLLLPGILLFYTHMSSLFVIFIHFCCKKERLLLLFIGIPIILYLFNSYIIPLTWYEPFQYGKNQFSSIDKYYLSSLIALILIQGSKFIKNSKFIALIFISIIYLFVSINLTIVKRLFFGIGWFWLIIVGFQIIEDKNIFKSSKKITFISILLISTKVIILFQRFIS